MPKPKAPQVTYMPPNGNSTGSNNGSTNNHHISLSSSISSASLSSNHTYNSDLRREKSSSSFKPLPVISGPIPPLPQRQHHQSLAARDSSASLRDREYRDLSGSARRPPSRDPSGGSTASHTSKFNPYTIVVSPNGSITDGSNTISVTSQHPSAFYNHQDNLSPHSPPLSVTSSLSPSSTSHMSTQSTSTAATHNTPRGSVSSSRSHEISNPIIQPFSIPGSPSARSSLYSTIDDNHGTSTRTGKSNAEFHLERPTDDAVIEQMFNDLIVSIER